VLTRCCVTLCLLPPCEQDTNAQVIRALTAALGVSAKRDLDMNSLCVPRKAKEVRMFGRVLQPVVSYITCSIRP
jgi:hypothetical protein